MPLRPSCSRLQTQELPSLLLVSSYCARAGLTSFVQHPTSLRTLLAALVVAHYFYRSLLYPLRIRGTSKSPLSVWALAFLFCCWNGYLQVFGALMRARAGH